MKAGTAISTKPVDLQNERHCAYAVDFVLWHVIGYTVFTVTGLVEWSKTHLNETSYTIMAISCLLAWRSVFLLKDGIRGVSPGKWLFDLRVVRTDTGNAIGPMGSLKRNALLIIPVVGELIIGTQMQFGYRWFNDWANCQVVGVGMSAQRNQRIQASAELTALRPLPRSQCAACDYDLRGLPYDRACPECGLFREEGAMCFRPSGAWRFVVHAGMWCCLLLVVGVWYGAAESGLDHGHWGVPGSLIVVSLIIAVYFHRRWKYRHHREFVIIGTTSICWRVAGCAEFRSQWRDITRISSSSFRESISFQLRGQMEPVSMPRCLWPKSVRFDTFVDILQKAWEAGRMESRVSSVE